MALLSPTTNGHESSQQVALFGPQVTNWTRQSLSQLQETLRQNADLDFLVKALVDVPSLCHMIEWDLGLSGFCVADKLEELRGFATGKTIPDTQTLSNSHLAPLTVVSQVVELVRLTGSRTKDASLPSFRTAQGFCIGFLSAAALASSDNWAEFETRVAIALRLAVCIGAMIDAEDAKHAPEDRATAISVRCKSPSDRTFLETTLDLYPKAYISCITDERAVTITLSKRDLSSFCSRLSDEKIAAVYIGLSGSYHHSKHNTAARILQKICAKDPSLQLPGANALRLPLRSTATAEIITTGALHEVAIDLILCKRAHWFQTISRSLDDLSGDKINFSVLGQDFSVPRSLSSAKSTSSQDGKEAQEKHEEIAVVGMACRFPQADSLDEFWQLISSGGNATTKLPIERFNPAEISREPTMPNYWGNFLRRPDSFDHRFFGVSGREAKSMDPQQRLALEVAYEALKSSGYCNLPVGAKETNIGCYVGAVGADYEENVASENANAFSATGTLRAFISGRISHFFGWTGPSLVLDTACSSSAVAIHTACRALLSGECSMALAGGVNVITSNNMYQNLAAGRFLNPNGSSRAFDAAGAGYCRGEGAGMLVLKPLSRAVAEGATIFGVVSGSGINQGSNSSSITVPDSSSQSSLYEAALSMSRIHPKEVTYVEAHGTGTPVGDPIEYESVRTALTGSWRSEELFLGSVKDNIGHLEAASGVAGVIKTLLMMHHKSIPKQANFVSLNPKIKVSSTDRITIPTTTKPWTPRRHVALVNNYGAAGSNAAIVLREYSNSSNKLSIGIREEVSVSHPILLSAKSPSNLQSYMDALKQYVAMNPTSFGDIAYHLSRTQDLSFEHRAAFTVKDAESLVSVLDISTAGAGEIAVQVGKRPVVLAFGGQTGRKVSISKELYDNCDLLRSYLDECASICGSLGLPDILQELFHGEIIEDIMALHCALLSVQVSSAKCWIDCGLQVDTLIGHSFGQLSALCIAGSISLEDAFRFVSGRARLIRDSWGPEAGVMLSVECDRDSLEVVVDRINSTATFWVDIACVNGATSFVLAGDRPSMEKAEEECRSASISTKRLQNSHAYHSYIADGILDDLEVVAESIQMRPPLIHVETCSSDGTWTTFTPDRLVQHTRQPVYFFDAVQRIANRLPSAVWVEAGSASPITAMARRILRTTSRTDVFIPMDLSGDAAKNLSNATCQLWESGCSVQYWPFHPTSQCNYGRITLPPYQFEKTSHWIDYKPMSAENLPEVIQSADVREPKLVTMIGDGQSTGEYLFSVDTSHAVFDLATRGHAVTSQSLCPAPMYVELATRCILEASNCEADIIPHVEGLTMSAPLGLGGESAVSLRLRRAGQDSWDFSVFSFSHESEVEHASGRIGILSSDDTVTNGQLKMLKKIFRNTSVDRIQNSPSATGVSGPIVYKLFEDIVKYAGYYRGIKSLSALENEAAGLVSVPTEKPFGMEAGICDPISLDNFLQVAGIHINCLSDRKDEEVFMCTAIEEIIFSAAFMADQHNARSWTVYSRYESTSKGTTAHDVVIYDAASKELVVAIMGAQFRSVPYKSLARSLTRLNAGNSPVVRNKRDFDSDSFRDSGYTTRTGTPPLTPPLSPPLGIQYEKPSPTLPSKPDQRLMQPISEKLRAQTQAQSKPDNTITLLIEMFSSIMEVPVEEIKSSSDLSDIGVDSLLATEVLSEIQQRFNVNITQAQFLECTDILSLCRLIRPREEPMDSLSPPSKTHENDGASDESVSNRASSVCDTLVDNASDFGEAAGENVAVVSHGCFADAKDSLDELSESTLFANFCTDVFPLQSKLVVQYVLEAFTARGSPLERLRPGATIPAFDFDKKQEKLIPQLFNILADAGLVTKADDGSFARTAIPLPTGSAATLHAEMLAKFPKHASETKLLHATAQKLADCLNGTADPLALMFRDPVARSLLEDVYKNAPMFKTITLLLSKYLSSVVGRLGSSRREVRILEIGAGTGGTTQHLGEALSLLGDNHNFSYTFTDLSSSLVANARRKFSKWSFMKYAVLDAEQSPTSQFEGAYDIIISTNCIHATKDLVHTTTNIRKMLRPDGVLCLVEATRNLFWYDLVWGLLEGWWLFDDGREHALVDEMHWARCLRAAGFEWVDWSDSPSAESSLLRIITASSFNAGTSADTMAMVHRAETAVETNDTRQTLVFKSIDGLDLKADIYYPRETVEPGTKLPVALMIHGGGHVMLSRNDIRPEQTAMLLKSGLLPVSIDYRLCPETTLIEGPMTDVGDALAWVRHVLPKLPLSRPDIRVDGEKVVGVGWSTGGHLAMSLAWTSIPKGVRPPEAILAFYCPTDYEDPFWMQPNVPAGSETASGKPTSYELDDGIWSAVSDQPLTMYNVPRTKRALGGWMASSDQRSRLVLHMNWHGRALHVLLNGLDKQKREDPPAPSPADVVAASPLAQIRRGRYNTPTFIIHPRQDDLIPWQQAQRTWQGLCARGVDSELRIVEDVPHLFDLYREHQGNPSVKSVVTEGYNFLCRYVGLELRA